MSPLRCAVGADGGDVPVTGGTSVAARSVRGTKIHAVHSRPAAALEPTARCSAPWRPWRQREIVATVYEGLAGLPHFSPDDDVDPLPPAVAALRSQIRSAHALALTELAGHVAPTWRYVAVQQPLVRRDHLAVLASLGGGQRSQLRSAVVRVATCANRIYTATPTGSASAGSGATPSRLADRPALNRRSVARASQRTRGQ